MFLPSIGGRPSRSRSRRRGAGAALLGLALTAAACSSTDDTATSPGNEQTLSSTASDESSADTPNADTLGAATFDGEATTIGGMSFDLGALANKDLVIWFWAPW